MTRCRRGNGEGLGWAGESGGRERTPARQAALCGAAGAQPSKPPCVGGTGASPSPLGSLSTGCDGGTAAGASPRVGTIRPRGEGAGWRCGQVDFLQGAGRRGVVAG